MKKLLSSRKTKFQAGGMVFSRIDAEQFSLTTYGVNRAKGMDASEIAAESHGFARKWGGRLVA